MKVRIYVSWPEVDPRAIEELKRIKEIVEQLAALAASGFKLRVIDDDDEHIWVVVAYGENGIKKIIEVPRRKLVAAVHEYDKCARLLQFRKEFEELLKSLLGLESIRDDVIEKLEEFKNDLRKCEKIMDKEVYEWARRLLEEKEDP